ncbi:MAG: MFS transporter [Thermoplasmataceae archaeon]
MINPESAGVSESYAGLRQKIDNSHWNISHTFLFTAVSSSFFAWGIFLSVAALATNWPFVPTSDFTLILLSSPLGLLLGNLVMGKATDVFGRRNVYVITVILGLIGIIGVDLSTSVIPLFISIFIAELGFGGDETVSLSYLSETVPIKKRNSSLILSSNFANVGVAVAAAIFILTSGLSSSILDQKILISVAAGAAMLISLLARLNIPESERWRYVRRNREKNVTTTSGSPAVRYVVLLFMAMAVILGFALTSFTIGPYEFPAYTSYFPLVTGVAESVSAIFAVVIANRLSRGRFGFVGYLGGLATILLLLPAVEFFPASLTLLFVIIGINSFFGEVAWATREVMQPELFTTGSRGMGIGSVRALAYLAYVISVLAVPILPVTGYIYYIAFFWAIGLAGAVIWLLKGSDTSRTSIV